MSSSIKISWAIPVCNEHKELDRLLCKLMDHINPADEIVVVFDEKNWTDEAMDTYRELQLTHKHLFVGDVNFHRLDGDFASHKNFINSICTKDWIFQIDADEYPSDFLLENIHSILEQNEDVDAIWVPRINTVEGLTDEDVKKWRWAVNDKGWVNFPDWQCRLYRNKPEIKWKNKVHEQLTGAEVVTNFPPMEEFSLYHPKDIERQRRQNEFYETL